MKNRITILPFLLLALMISFSGCTDNSTAQKSELATVNSIEEIDAMLESAPVFIMVGSVNCPACTKEKPVVEDLAAEYKDRVWFVYIDYDQQPQLKKRYYGQYGMPDMHIIVKSENERYFYVSRYGEITDNRYQAIMLGALPKGVLEVNIQNALKFREEDNL